MTRPAAPTSAADCAKRVGPVNSPADARSLAAFVLAQARKQFDAIAGLVAVIELVLQDHVPGIPAAPGRTGQREEVGPLRPAGSGPRLDRGSANLLVAEIGLASGRATM